MTTELKNTNVAILMTDGVEQAEYAEPRRFLEQQGAKVTLISTKNKGEQIQAFNHMQPGSRYAVAEWSDQEVLVDGKLITSRKPDDIPAFNQALQQQLMAA